MSFTGLCFNSPISGAHLHISAKRVKRSFKWHYHGPIQLGRHTKGGGATLLLTIPMTSIRHDM